MKDGYLDSEAASSTDANARTSDVASDRNEANYRELFELSADALLIIRNGRFIDCNQATVRMLRYQNKKELLDTHPSELSPEFQSDGRLSREKADEMMRRAETEKTLRFEWDHKRADGEVFPVEVSLTSIADGAGDRILHTSWRDITERKRMQEAVEKRIMALTRPPQEAEEVTFEELFSLDEIQNIQDEFASATGVASIITQTDGTPITKPSNFTELCMGIIRMTEKGCANCYASDAVLGRSHPEGPVVQRCMSGGLWDAGAGIHVGNRHIANWLIGQVRDETQTEEGMRAYAREIGADEERTLEAFRKVPVLSRERFDAIAKALFTLARQLSVTAYQNVQQARFIAEEKRRTQELRRLSAAIEQSAEAITITDPAGLIQYVNPAFEAITGYAREEIVGQNPRFLKSGKHDAEFYTDLWTTISSGQTWEGRIINKRKDGSLCTHEATISAVYDTTGAITNYVAIKRDITDELIREKQYLQGQKMEAVGQLAGGIAHDFNNLLQTIFGFSELLRENVNDEPGKEYLAHISSAALRASELTKQLLTFSRRQTVNKTPIDLNRAVRETMVLLEVLLSRKRIECEFDLGSDLHAIYADHSQMTQVVMNLAVNARDAMSDGGCLSIATANVSFTPEDIERIPETVQQDYVRLRVSDTGHGIDKEVKDRLFEPFFTTKDLGTGLGLAVLYGIITEHDGWIEVVSEEAQGATFDCYLPACTMPVDQGTADQDADVLS